MRNTFSLEPQSDAKNRLVTSGRIKPPDIVINYTQELLAIINPLVLNRITLNQPVIWNEIHKKVTQYFANKAKDEHEFIKLHTWLASPSPKGTFLKTIYLHQLYWNNEWNEYIKYDTFKDSDWQSLPNIPEDFKDHAAYLIKLNYEIQQRIQRSAKVGESRFKKMVARDDHLKSLLNEAVEKLSSVSHDQKGYTELLKQLIIQSLIKIDEIRVQIFCRASDLEIVKKILPQAYKDYETTMIRECGSVTPVETILNENTNFNLPENCCGGIVLTALGGKIVCDNTLKARLSLIYEELLPQIREMLFPTERIAHDNLAQHEHAHHK